jgi:hypothetical protein
MYANYQAKKNRLQETAFYVQALVRPRPAYPQQIHPRRKAYSYLIMQASINNDLLMVGANNSEELERAFATS